MSNIVQVPFAPSLNSSDPSGHSHGTSDGVLWCLGPRVLMHTADPTIWACLGMFVVFFDLLACSLYGMVDHMVLCLLLGGWHHPQTPANYCVAVRWSMLFTSPVSSLKAYVMVQSVGLKHALSFSNKQNNPTEECCLLYMAFHIYLHIVFCSHTTLLKPMCGKYCTCSQI